MKKYVVVLVGMVSMLGVISSLSYAISFTDLQGYQYADSVQFLADRGIVKGYPDGTYGVNKPISRAELLKIMIEGLGIPAGEKNLQNCFSDVTSERYAPYVCYAKQEGIAKGYPDGAFRPNANVTIGEGLKMTLHTFSMGIQEGTGHEWYMPYIDFVHNNTIFSKYTIYPRGDFTRGQMAFLTHKLLLHKQGSISFTNVRENKSAGCGKPMPATSPSESLIQGIARHYITVVGRNYSPTVPTPLIFAFHGRTNPNTQVQSYYGIDKASEGNAIIIYPLGLPESGPTRNWTDPGDKSNALRDFALFDQLVQEFEENYCINTDEIYVMGHSLGGRFTNALACSRGDVIRGMGSVGSSSIGKQSCTGPVQAIIMHNPEDNLASYAGGVAMRDLFIKNNGCDPDSATTYTSPSNAQCVQYICASGSPVVRCPYTDSIERGRYYPHVRPNYAGQVIWDFWKGNKE